MNRDLWSLYYVMRRNHLLDQRMFVLTVLSCLYLSAYGHEYLSRQKRIVWIGVQYQPQHRPPSITPMPPYNTVGIYAPHICAADFVPDVFAQTGDGNTYVFAGDSYWHIMDFEGNVVDNRQQPGQPISRDWAGLPSHLDAALTLADGQTLFYKEDKFYVYWNKSPRDPISGQIEHAFPQIPTSNLDAAFMTNTSLIFIKDDSFYVFGIEQFPFVQRGQLVDMGLPHLPVEAAVNLSDGLAYVIVDKTAYQLDTISLQVVSSFPTQSLYGCLEPLMAVRRLVNIPYGRKFSTDRNDIRNWTSAFLIHTNNLQ